MLFGAKEEGEKSVSPGEEREREEATAGRTSDWRRVESGLGKFKRSVEEYTSKDRMRRDEDLHQY